MMWPAILGMTYALLPSDKAGLAGGLILGVGRARQRDRAAARRRPHRRAELALGLLPQPARSPRSRVLVTWRIVARRAATPPTHRIDYAGVAHALRRARRAPARARRGHRLGLRRPARSSALFASCAVAARGAFVFVERRAGAMRAGARRRAWATASSSAACLAVLLMSAMFFAALLYLPQFMRRSSATPPLEAGRRPAAADGRRSRWFVRRRAALRAPRGRSRSCHAGAACLAVGIFCCRWSTPTIELPRARARHGRARHRRRALLLVDHHRRR